MVTGKQAIGRGRVTSLVVLLGMTLIFGLSGCGSATSVSTQPANLAQPTATQVEKNAPAQGEEGNAGKDKSTETVKGTGKDSETDQGQAAGDTGTEALNPQEDLSDVAPVPMTPPQPDPPQTPIRPFYELAGTPPEAPGLAMRHRVFKAEPKKIAYLTIDDGPSQNTLNILKILKDEGVHATFFVIGRQIEKYPDYLKQEHDEGNAIGNHTYSHNYAEIYKSPQAYLANIKKNEDLIYRLIGIRPPIIRTPGGTQGNFHVSYYNAVDAAGYLVYDWNVSTGDAAASLVPADQLVKNIESQIPGKDRAIILMHDAPGKTTTVEALPRIIQYLKKQGFSFGILGPEVAPILFPGGFRS